MVRDYIIALMTKGGFSVAAIARMSGVAEATVRKVVNGETPDPRFETSARIITALGGSLDDAFSTKKEKAVEVNAVTELKSCYEIRIESLHERFNDMVERLNEFRQRETRTNRIIRMLAIAVAVLVLIIIALFAVDILIGTHGWVRY